MRTLLAGNISLLLLRRFPIIFSQTAQPNRLHTVLPFAAVDG